jgi:succinate dehydrogenase / fumarate reductase membrane anchor subunit
MRDQRWWTWHIAAGAVILVFLGLHMAVMHLDELIGAFNVNDAEHPIAWANVLERSRSAFFMVTYVVLLGAALFHGLYGLRNILVELNPAPALRRAIGPLLLVGGAGLFGFGTWAAVASFFWLRSAQ